MNPAKIAGALALVLIAAACSTVPRELSTRVVKPQTAAETGKNRHAVAAKPRRPGRHTARVGAPTTRPPSPGMVPAAPDAVPAVGPATNLPPTAQAARTVKPEPPAGPRARRRWWPWRRD